MKHFLILVAFVNVFILKASGQVKIFVTDSLSKSPLQHATIFQFSKNLLTLSNDQGTIDLDFTKADTVKISYAGYFDKYITIDKRKSYQVELVRNIEILPEVLFKPCTHWSKPILYKPAATSEEFGGFAWGKIGDRGRIAMFLSSQEENCRLLGLMLNFKVGPAGTKEAAKAPILFSFYTVDTSTMLPSNLLTSKTIFFSPKSLGKQWISFDNINLVLPKEGLYVSMESYQDDAYSYLLPLQSSSGSIDTVKCYGGGLDGIYTKESWLSFYNFKTSKWFFSGAKPLDRIKAHGAIWYKIKYSICTEN